jgi:predicted nucleotidyltransferase
MLRLRREEIVSLADKHGVRNVRVFGSVARGEERPDSDVDLLVDMEPGRSLMDLGGFQYEAEERLCLPVDVVTERGLRRRIHDRVLEEAVPL